MSSEEWFALPGWEAELLIQGLEEEFGVGNKDAAAASTQPSSPGAPPPPEKRQPNLASAELDVLSKELGVQVRRAG